MKRLRVERELLAAGARAPATLRSRGYDWSNFSAWCKRAGRCELPATAETVELYVTDELRRGLKVSSVTRRICTVSTMHKSKGLATPILRGGGVYALLSGARRIRKEQPAGKTAISADELREISRALAVVDGAAAVRNRAIMVVGFASGMRRSELAALELSDLEFGAEGFTLRIRSSKRDQEGKGRRIGIFPGRRAASCPVRTLKAWLRARGRWPGPLFCRIAPSTSGVVRKPINSESVNQVVKKCVGMIGLDPAGYGAHSLRAGCVTAAIATGCSELAIMQRTGHRAITTLQRYVRPKVFAFDPLARAL